MIERLMLRASAEAADGGDPYAAVNPELILGPIVIGLVFNVWLYGMQLIQVENYYRSNPRDSRWIKALVLFLLVADTLNTVFDVWFTYDYCVKKFGDKREIMFTTWIFNTDPVMTVVVSSTVQGFFAWRVRKLTGMTWLAVIIGLAAIAQLFLGIAVGIAASLVGDFTKFHRFKSIVIAWLIAAPVTDVTISAALVWFLQKNKTGFAVTDDLVGKITRLTIQTGAITAVWAVIDLATFLSMTNNIHLIFNMPLAKLYSNCLMSSLNARRQWGGTTFTSGMKTSGKGEMRAGIHVTTTTAQETYEMERYGGAFDGTTTTGVTRATDTKRKTMDDGLSLRSDSVDGYGGNDALDSRQKMADEETPPPPLTPTSISVSDRNQNQVQVQVQPPTPLTQLQLSQPQYYKPPRVKSQTPLPASGRGTFPGSNRNNNNNTNNNNRNPYINVSNFPAPPLTARGGRNEVNVEWSKEL